LAVIFGENLFLETQINRIWANFFRLPQTVFVSYGHLGMVTYHWLI